MVSLGQILWLGKFKTDWRPVFPIQPFWPCATCLYYNKINTTFPYGTETTYLSVVLDLRKDPILPLKWSDVTVYSMFYLSLDRHAVSLKNTDLECASMFSQFSFFVYILKILSACRQFVPTIRDCPSKEIIFPSIISQRCSKSFWFDQLFKC